MCGIAGKFHFDDQQPVSQALLDRMANRLVHRGPDDSGFFTHGPVGLAHRRLSIIDVSAAGKQPICNEDGSVWTVFNGEIYNYRELRRTLVDAGHRFKTNTDTEVIVHLWEEYGEKMVDYLVGMFTFALWDDREQQLVVARDRVGIKPLYWAETRSGIVFASEIKALLADPEVAREVDPRAVDRFLAFRYMPGEATLLHSVRKLRPGHLLIVDAKGWVERRYWDLDSIPNNTTKRFEDSVDELRDLLGHVIRDHQVSDVPVGYLLSGGLDSTGILALGAETAVDPQSFTVGFSGAGVTDERPYARLAAERFGTSHHETTFTFREFRDFLPDFVRIMEEPVCEPPAVALHFVAKLASQHVKVVMSGEGGDEAFAGYSTYRNAQWMAQLGRFLPGPTARWMLSAIPSARSWAPLAGRSLDEFYFGRTTVPPGLFLREHDRWYAPEFRETLDRDWSLAPAREFLERCSGRSPLDRMLYVDTMSWLPDDLLLKADKITMSHSLELRVPLLDHRVLEFAASLPPDHRLRGRETKRVLRAALAGVVPQEILDRPKAGFPVPYEGWLRGEMREFVSDLLLSETATTRPYFRRSAVEALLRENLAHGKHAKEVFCLLVLELWHRSFIDSGGLD